MLELGNNVFWTFSAIETFGFVSDFDIRHSNFPLEADHASH